MNLQQNEDRAEVQKDAAALDRLLADDFFTVQPNGNISTKAEYIALITRSGDHPPPTFNYSDVSVRSYDNTAVVNYRVDITECWWCSPVSGQRRMVKTRRRMESGDILTSVHSLTGTTNVTLPSWLSQEIQC